MSRVEEYQIMKKSLEEFLVTSKKFLLSPTVNEVTDEDLLAFKELIEKVEKTIVLLDKIIQTEDELPDMIEEVKKIIAKALMK